MKAPDPGLWFLNTHVTVQLPHAEGEDGISILMLRMDRDDAPPLHVHRGEDEAFHVVEGSVRFLVGDTTKVAHAGETVLGPQGVPHGFRVVSDRARMLVVTRRGGFERLVRAMSRPAESDGPPAFSEPTPEMQEELARQCAAVGIDILGPPIG